MSDVDVRLVQVTKAYGGLVAVNGVSLTLRVGEILGLIGPNGSGKTTLVGCIAGTHTASGGRVLIDNQDVTRLPAFRVARLGVGRTFQTIRLFAHMTVLENVMAALAQRQRRLGRRALESEALRLLGHLHIAEFAARAAGELAYGQQRRVEIARALALDPRFLLLDEPAAGMNPQEAMELMRVIRWLRDQFSLTILLVEHNMKVVMGICETVQVIDYGETIAIGTACAWRASRSCSTPGRGVTPSLSTNWLNISFLRFPSAALVSSPGGSSGLPAGISIPRERSSAATPSYLGLPST